MSTGQFPVWKPDEYLRYERLFSSSHHDFIDGTVIWAGDGASVSYRLIGANLRSSLKHLLPPPYVVSSSPLRLKTPPGLYTYPAVSVVQGQPEWEDAEQDTLLNPILLVELFSKFTEQYARITKFGRYQLLGSLQEYILVNQDRPEVERYYRGSQWSLTKISGLDGVLELASVPGSLRLWDVYYGVEFLPTDDESGTGDQA